LVTFEPSREYSASAAERRGIQACGHTIVHEVAHQFGISDERLRDIDAY
jgi:predicted Zn-dependent protease with MMP-like domain